MTQYDNGYNGWMNRNTWAINLWMTNDPGIEDMINEWIDDQYEDKETVTAALASFIQDFIDTHIDLAWNEMPESFGKSLIQDMMDTDQIDYESIAEGYLDDYVEDQEELELEDDGQGGLIEKGI
jgi:hypothetical protein